MGKQLHLLDAETERRGYLLAGGASGRHNARLNVTANGPTSNILLTALRIMGIEKDSIGDSTGPVKI